MEKMKFNIKFSEIDLDDVYELERFIRHFCKEKDIECITSLVEIKNEAIVERVNPKFHNSGCYQPTVDNTKFPPPKSGSNV